MEWNHGMGTAVDLGSWNGEYSGMGSWNGDYRGMGSWNGD